MNKLRYLIITISNIKIHSHWSTVFPPCEQFLRRLWTMTGSQVKGGTGVAAAAGVTNEGIKIFLS